jgi:SAM-dependent methyltransferase
MNGTSMLDKFKKMIAPPSVNLNLSKHIPALLAELGPQAKVLELGCGKRRRAEHITNADLVPYPEVDVVTDAHNIAFKKGYFDAVIVDAMLEHVSDPQAVVQQIHDILKPGGYIYCEIPFLQMYHPAPRDFQRYTIEGIDRLFAAFHKIDTGVAVGPTSAICGMLQGYVPMLINIPIIRTMLYYMIGWTGFLLRYLDLLLVRNKNSHILASSLYYFGKK